MNKDLLCEAFCGELEFRDVPAGIAVKTVFRSLDGDPIGFYITPHPTDEALFRIEDTGLIVPTLEANGIDLDSGARSDVFEKLLVAHAASYQNSTGELVSEYVAAPALPKAAMRFIALMLRVGEMDTLNPGNVANTFRDDATASIQSYFDGKASLTFNVPLPDSPADLVPDVTIAPLSGGNKLALYLATTRARIDEAVMLWMESQWHSHDFHVAVLLESENKIPGPSLRRAINRVNVASYRGDEIGSMQRLAHYAGINGNVRLN